MRGRIPVIACWVLFSSSVGGCRNREEDSSDFRWADFFYGDTGGAADTAVESDTVVDSDMDRGTCEYECIGSMQCTLLDGIEVAFQQCGEPRKTCCNFWGAGLETESETDSGGDLDADADADSDADTNSDTDTEPNANPGTPVTGLDIQKIALYQGVEIPLMENGTKAESQYADVVRSRDAILRVFVERQSSWTDRTIRAVLDLEGAGISVFSPREVDKFINRDSSPSLLSSTINFQIPAQYLNSNFSYRVSLFEVGGSFQGSSDSSAWPQTGMDSVTVLGTNGTLRIIIIPIAYNADGSGRIPDTEESTLNAVRDQFYMNYPVAYDDIDISVGEVFSWEDEVNADGRGWEELLSELSAYKNNAGSSAQEYYFGLFDPHTSLTEYCRFGCVVGLGYVPWTANQAEAKVAVGVGFDPSTAAVTMIHEVGHNHGREHAPCGDVEMADPDFPYDGGSIGTWGYDPLSGQLKNPNIYTDFMGYCEQQWVSDYTFGGIFDWIRDTNRSFAKKGVETTWRSLHIGASGARIGRDYTLTIPPQGQEIAIYLYDVNQEPLGEMVGWFTPHRPLEGGMVLFADPVPEVMYVSVDKRELIAL